MKSTAKTLALGAALLCLLAGGMALLSINNWRKKRGIGCRAPDRCRRVAALEQRQQRAC